jgi:hypothetical protein
VPAPTTLVLAAPVVVLFTPAPSANVAPIGEHARSQGVRAAASRWPSAKVLMIVLTYLQAPQTQGGGSLQRRFGRLDETARDASEGQVLPAAAGARDFVWRRPMICSDATPRGRARS